MKHVLPPLPYKHAALEPHIDARSMLLHHEVLHAGYVSRLNAALKKYPELHERSTSWLLANIAEVPEAARTAVGNNAGGHLNHSLFWRSMSPAGGGTPAGLLADAIERDFGSFEQFKAEFSEAGGAVFGSGWVWLVRAGAEGGKLSICTTAGHDNPIAQGQFPLLVNDVWEHAYYLKHENRRADYLKGWWAIADWREAGRRFERSDHSAELEWEEEGGLVLAQTTPTQTTSTDQPGVPA